MYESSDNQGLPSITGIRPNSIAKPAHYSSPQSKFAKPDVGPMTASQAIALYRRALTPYETDEIKKYKSIWFVGKDARKINAGEGKGKNFGYDDDKGRYKCIKNDHIG